LLNTVHRLSQPQAPPSAFSRVWPLSQAPAHPTVTAAVGADVVGTTEGALLLGPAVGALVVGATVGVLLVGTDVRAVYSVGTSLGNLVGGTEGAELLGATVESSSKQTGVPVPSCGAQWRPVQHCTFKQLSPAVFRHPVMPDGEELGSGVAGDAVGTVEGILVGAIVEGGLVGCAVGTLLAGAAVGVGDGALVLGAVVGMAVGIALGMAVGAGVDGGWVSPLHCQP